MSGTGKHVTPEELAELQELAKDAREAPVMTPAIGRPTFAESAAKRLQDRINALAARLGLARDDWNYGVHPKTGEVLE